MAHYSPARRSDLQLANPTGAIPSEIATDLGALTFLCAPRIGMPLPITAHAAA